MCIKILLILLFVTVAICNRGLQNTDVTVLWNQLSYRNGTYNISSVVSTTKDKVELKLYYETLCPASVNFFVSQLNPAVKRLGSHLDVHLIPYGHAMTYHSHGRYSFNCQHGPPECYGNMVHACAIDVLRNNTHAILFNSCLMQYTSYHSDYNYFVSVLRWCGYTEKVQIHEIWKCIHVGRGATLLKDYGDDTHALSLTYVPYMLLDGSTKHQDEAASNLLATVCSMLSPKPIACSNHR